MNIERDEHLLAALRHAPDHDVAPPAALSQAILKQAREASTTARPAVPKQRGGAGLRLRLAAWFGVWPPMPTAALGTVAVAGLVGVMWSTREPPKVVNELPVAAVAPAPVAPPAQTAPPAAPKPAAVEAPPETHGPRSAVERRSAPVRTEAAPRKEMEISVATAAPPLATPQAADASAASPDTPVAAVPMQAQVDSAKEPAAANIRLPALSAEAVAAKAEIRSKARGADASVSSLAAPAAPALRAAVAAESPMDAATAALNAPATASPKGQWQLAGRSVPHGEAQKQWLDRLRAATSGRWLSATPADVPGRMPLASLRADDHTLGSLWIESQGSTGRVVWRDAAGAVWVGRMEEPSALTQQLADW